MAASGCAVVALVGLAQVTPAAAQRSPQDNYDGTTATYEMPGGTTLRRGERLLDPLVYTVWQKATVKGAGRCIGGACPVTFNGETVWARASRLIVLSGPEATASPGITGRIGDAIRGATDRGSGNVRRTRLERGDSGEDVRQLQEALNRQGAGLRVDGNFGRSVVSAVSDYQRRRGLKVDGIAGRETLRELGLLDGYVAGRDDRRPDDRRDDRRADDRRPDDRGYQDEPRRRLERGDRGEEVRRLQEALNRDGARLTVDGNYGRSTVDAVSSYQRRRGLKVDGIAGRETLRQLGV
jgi:peptidoglycan hydrolase-like protein with peptidoglycan-binding domain